MKDAEMKALLIRVMDRMLEARWLHSHIYTDGKGHHLVWTPEGSERAYSLKRIAHTYRLLDDDRAPHNFDVVTKGLRFPGFGLQSKVRPELGAYWRESVELLRLSDDFDGLLAMVHIVEVWGPDLVDPAPS